MKEYFKYGLIILILLVIAVIIMSFTVHAQLLTPNKTPVALSISQQNNVKAYVTAGWQFTPKSATIMPPSYNLNPNIEVLRLQDCPNNEYCYLFMKKAKFNFIFGAVQPAVIIK